MEEAPDANKLHTEDGISTNKLLKMKRQLRIISTMLERTQQDMCEYKDEEWRIKVLNSALKNNMLGIRIHSKQFWRRIKFFINKRTKRVLQSRSESESEDY